MSLYRQPKSRKWWVRISVAGIKTRRSTGTEDRAQAEEFEQRERARLWRLHKLGDRGALSWKEATERYLSESDRSRTRDRAILQRLSADLDPEAVRAVDADAIEELRKGLLEDGLARSTVDRHMRTVRAVLKACARWGILEAAPAVPMYGGKGAPPRWLSQAEFARLKAKLAPELAIAAEFAVYTGLRMRSQAQLTWDRVDLRTRRLWIPRQHMKAGGDHGIPLSPTAVRVLRAARRRGAGDARVFRSWFGGNFNTKAFRSAAKAAGLEGLRWHDLRHTFAAWAVQSGVTLQELMQLGGWASYASVLVYAHLAPDHLAEAAAKIGRNRAYRVARGTCK